jgi:16S rRNA (guanine527-N7)-methyltransferase
VVSGGVPDPSRLEPPEDVRPAANVLFGDGLPLAERFAGSLATDGVVRGLIGPREAGRIWDRHLLNCVALAPALPAGGYIVDVGSGAGLPGVVLGIARPDLIVVLIEPLERRAAFLTETIDTLNIGDRVTVVRGRAEDIGARPAMFHVKPADVVTARAVAPLDRLAAWCLPLAAVGGRVMAIKGASAHQEVAAHTAEVARLGGGGPRVREYGVGMLAEPTTVVEFTRQRVAGGSSSARTSSRGRRGGSARNDRRR